MNRKATLGAVLAMFVAAPAIVAPRLVDTANAQTTRDNAEFPDVPKNHWAYEALNKLASAGIIEGREGGVYVGNASMTRYEFGVAIARLLDKLNVTTVTTPTGETVNLQPLLDRLSALEAKPDGISRAEVLELIAALRTEFADELARAGVRITDLEARMTAVENRVAAPPRLTLTPSLYHAQGSANYIDNGYDGEGFGRTIANVDNDFGGRPNNLGGDGVFDDNGVDEGGDFTNGKFGYTELELRLTDRVTDRLSVNAAIRALSSTQEDPWTGEPDDAEGLFGGGLYVREANVVANLNRVNLILGRQRTKLGQGLLYDNDLAPTDQMNAQFNLGPLSVTGFIGGVNNQNGSSGGLNAYLTSGASRYIGLDGDDDNVFFPGNPAAQTSGAAAGFPTILNSTVLAEDNESLVRVGFNLFRISGNPVTVNVTRQFDGVAQQKGDSVDLTLPLFDRTLGVEYVRQRQYANGNETEGNPSAYNITLPVLRSRVLDFNVAYGKADDDFEFFLASAANPFARTYGEAVFDRRMALGAPLISEGGAGLPTYAAAKKVLDFEGTLRLFRRLPLNFRYYTAKGSETAAGTENDLGSVFSVGSTFNLTPGVDLEVKYGQYNPKLDNYDTIKYFRVAANVGF